MQRIVNGVLVDMSSEEIAAHEAAQEEPPPPPAVPPSVTRLQAKLALYAAGRLADAEAAVQAAGGVTVLFWVEATTFERAHPIIASLGAALGLDPQDIDDLFVAAAGM